MNTSHLRRHATIALLIACTSALPSSPPTYTVTPITWNVQLLDAGAFNDSAQITGRTYDSLTFLYDHGLTTALNPFGGVFSSGYDINNLGIITGRGYLPNSGIFHAFLSANGTTTDLGTLTGLNSMGFGINDVGMVTGQADTSTGEWHAFLYSGNTMIDLIPLDGWESGGLAINEAGEIAGYYVPPSTYVPPGTYGPRPILYSGGTILDLGALAGGNGYARDVNDLGQVVGQVLTKNGESNAFLYSQGGMHDLGALAGYGSDANAINNHGQIVGVSAIGQGMGEYRRGFLYSDGSMHDLNDLIVDSADWTLFIAYDINDLGQILCVGTGEENQWVPLLLTPIADSPVAVPEPSTWGVCGAFALGLSILFRRRFNR